MLRRDYIQRLIEEFAKVISRGLGLLKEGNTEQSIREMREAYRTWFALEAADLDQMEAAELLEKLKSNSEFELAKIESLAMGFKVEAVAYMEGHPLRGLRRDQALLLLEYVEQTDTTNFSFTRKAAISELRAMGDG
jgi:hypothetical protein